MGNQTSRISDEEKNTKFSRKQVEMWSEMFYSIFPNKRISFLDFKKILSMYFPNSDVNSISKHLFRAFTKSQYLDFQEFIKVYSAIVNLEKEALQKIMFNFYNIDNDEYLSKEEVLGVSEDLFKYLIEDLGYSIRLDYKNIIEEIFKDLNKERISFREFENYWSRSTEEFKIIFRFLEDLEEN